MAGGVVIMNEISLIAVLNQAEGIRLDLDYVDLRAILM